MEAAIGARPLSRDELRQVVEHVAQAWYSLEKPQRIPTELVGVRWKGRILQRGNRLPTDEVHYLRHVIVRQEWPSGTTFEQYRASLKEVILDPASGLLVSLFRDKGWHLAIVRRSGHLQGSHGYQWLMVEYRLDTGNLTTAFQLEKGLAYFDEPTRSEKRWLRRPR